MSVDGKHMGVTANAVLLLGYIGGRLLLGPDDTMYEFVEADAAAGTQIVRHRLTDNTYRIAVVQLAGSE